MFRMRYGVLTLINMIESSKAVSVHVTHPLDLKEQFGKLGLIEIGFGPQGHLAYGESFQGLLTYPSFGNTDACRPFDYQNFKVDPFTRQSVES